VIAVTFKPPIAGLAPMHTFASFDQAIGFAATIARETNRRLVDLTMRLSADECEAAVLLVTAISGGTRG
jgi:hypothetical protein